MRNPSAARPQATRLARDDLHFVGAHFTLGSFDCPRTAANFRDSGPIHANLLAFPRHAVAIEYCDRAEAFVADVHVVSIYRKGQHYLREAVSAYGDFCDWLSITPALHRELLADLAQPGTFKTNDLRSHALVSAEVFAGVRGLVASLSTRAAPPRPDHLQVEEQLFMLARQTLALAIPAQRTPEATAPDTHSRHRALAHRAQRLLAARFHQNLSLTAIARSLNTSPFHLSRIFRAEVGMPLHRYRQTLRLRHGFQRLMARPNRELTELALDLGFCDHSHFSANFRRSFGFPPSRLREQPAQRLREVLSKNLIVPDPPPV